MVAKRKRYCIPALWYRGKPIYTECGRYDAEYYATIDNFILLDEREQCPACDPFNMEENQ